MLLDRGTELLLLFWCFTAEGFHVPIMEQLSTKRTRLHAGGIIQGEPSMNTALCIVPPEADWDTIQRARYAARDATYRKWPPAIRLFHPFCPRRDVDDIALQIAQVIEKHHVRPFKIKLNSISVVPNLEKLEMEIEKRGALPVQEKAVSTDNPVETDVERLIRREEEVGRQRLRRAQQRRSAGAEESELTETQIVEEKTRKISPKQRLQMQKEMFEEFNGPCMVCLEPDPKSKEFLEELRDLLKQELFDIYDKFSPTSSLSETQSLPKSVQDGEYNFRPLVPIGDFPTVESAVKFARKLKGLWRPLSFEVTELHCISNLSERVSDTHLSEYANRNSFLAKATVRDSTGEQNFEESSQFGCDAAVMLIGEEIEQDEESNNILVNILLEKGVAGGADPKTQNASNKVALLDDDVSVPVDDISDVEDLLAWLDDEAYEDEGTVVVIGRTHFLSGEMRIYDGMPAASAVDGRDKIMGSGVDAETRRKATQKSLRNYEEGGFGF
jgi:hypothetical protein